VTVGVASTRDGSIHDWLNHPLTFIVEGSACSDGIIGLDAEFHWNVERSARADAPDGSTAS
jgi:hypothetical protein